MAIKVVCDICGEPHKIREERSGARMYCKACDNPVVVEGDEIPDDAEIVDEDPDETEPEIDEEDDWRPMAASLAGAVVGLIIMGFYVSFTISFLVELMSDATGPGRDRPIGIVESTSRPSRTLVPGPTAESSLTRFGPV